MGPPRLLSVPATVAIWNESVGNVSGRELVLPSTYRTILPTGALAMVNCPWALVLAERFVPLMLAVAFGMGMLALSSTIPLTVVFVAIPATIPDETNAGPVH